MFERIIDAEKRNQINTHQKIIHANEELIKNYMHYIYYT